MSAHFSRVMVDVALVFPDVIAGMTEASATRSDGSLETRNCGSTNAIGSMPILRVLVG